MKNIIIKLSVFIGLLASSSFAETLNEVTEQREFTLTISGTIHATTGGSCYGRGSINAGCGGYNMPNNYGISCSDSPIDVHNSLLIYEDRTYTCTVNQISSYFPSGADINVELISEQPLTTSEYHYYVINWWAASSSKRYRVTATYCSDNPDGVCAPDQPTCEQNEIVDSDNVCVCQDTFERVDGICVKPKEPLSDESDDCKIPITTH